MFVVNNLCMGEGEESHDGGAVGACNPESTEAITFGLWDSEEHGICNLKTYLIIGPFE